MLERGAWLLFGWVLLDQLGVPIPAAPALLAAGVLVRTGRMDFATTVGLAVVASLVGHSVWYEAGRRRGRAILQWMCRISVEPDLCVRRGESLMGRGGAATLILVRFIPGLDLVAQPLAALSGMSRLRYLAITAVGALVWAITFAALGYVFGNTLADLARSAGGLLVVLALGALLVWLGWKLRQRRRLLAELRMTRISAQELGRMLADGESPLIIDMRHPLDFAGNPRTIPGAVHVPAEQLDARIAEVPPDREIILYCT